MELESDKSVLAMVTVCEPSNVLPAIVVDAANLVAVAAFPDTSTLSVLSTLITPDPSIDKPSPAVTLLLLGASNSVMLLPDASTPKYLLATKLDGVSVKPKNVVEPEPPPLGASNKVTLVPAGFTPKYLLAIKLDGVSVNPKNVDEPLPLLWIVATTPEMSDNCVETLEIWPDKVVDKLGSSPNAAASSFKVFRVPGAESTNAAIWVST